MPAKPSYAHKLASAIEVLARSEARLVGRRDLEDLLGVSKTIAWRVLRACEAEVAPGGALLCERLVLIERLKRLTAKGGVVSREATRRQRVEDQLNQMRSFLRSRNTELVPVEQSTELRTRTFANLPASIRFTPRRLTLDYTTLEEFLAAIGSIVFALQNDIEEIRNFIDQA